MSNRCDACGRRLKPADKDGLCAPCLVEETMLEEEAAQDALFDDEDDD